MTDRELGRTRPTQTNAPAATTSWPRQLIEAEKSGRFHPLAIELYELLLIGDGATVAGIASKPNLRNLRSVRPSRDPSGDIDYASTAAAVRSALVHASNYVAGKLRERDKSGADYGAALRVLLALEPAYETWTRSERRAWAAAEVGKSVAAIRKTRYPKNKDGRYEPSYELVLISALADRIIDQESVFLSTLATSELLANHQTTNPAWAPPWFVAVAELNEVITWLINAMRVVLADRRPNADADRLARHSTSTERSLAHPEISLFLLGLFWARVDVPPKILTVEELDRRVVGVTTLTADEAASQYPPVRLPHRLLALLPFTLEEIASMVQTISTMPITDIPLHPAALWPFNPSYDMTRMQDLSVKWGAWFESLDHRLQDCDCASCHFIAGISAYRAFLVAQWGIVRDTYLSDPESW